MNALLSKLKGYSRTFVVHSNTNAYAAAAAMGAAMARSQQLGPYFNLSRNLYPRIEARASAPLPGAPAGDGVIVEFIADWSDFLTQKGMATGGLSYDPSRTLQENTVRYLIAHHRRVPITAPRAVHESRELRVPQQYQADYAALKVLIALGDDLKPYLSRDILNKKRPDKNDGLLNAWGVQHLHFRPQGTAEILLCRITDTDVFVIQALPHVHDVWVDTSLLQILHDNWPEEIASGKWNGIKREAVPSSERVALRNHNANFATTMTDGTVYLAPGGGLMASGDCFEDRSNSDKIFAELAYWQEVVRSNAAGFRAALNWPASKELSIKMAFKNRDCWLYEQTTGTRLLLTIQQ
jgi:hypothetical protein